MPADNTVLRVRGSLPVPVDDCIFGKPVFEVSDEGLSRRQHSAARAIVLADAKNRRRSPQNLQDAAVDDKLDGRALSSGTPGRIYSKTSQAAKRCERACLCQDLASSLRGILNAGVGGFRRFWERHSWAPINNR